MVFDGTVCRAIVVIVFIEGRKWGVVGIGEPVAGLFTNGPVVGAQSETVAGKQKTLISGKKKFVNENKGKLLELLTFFIIKKIFVDEFCQESDVQYAR